MSGTGRYISKFTLLALHDTGMYYANLDKAHYYNTLEKVKVL